MNRQAPPPTDRVSLGITWAIKLGGIVIAVHETFTTHDPAAYAVASVMMAGAQGVENVIKGRQ